MEHPIRKWDFTASAEKIEFGTIMEMLRNEKIKKWVFQKEKSESGYIHWQGRIVLHEKTRKMPLIEGLRWSATNNNCKNFNYVMKSETRIDGPWKDDDVNVSKLPWDLELISEWYPWQKEIMKMIEIKEDRLINVLWDDIGGIGKSKLFKYLLYNRKCKLIPVIGDAKDIIQAVCSMGESDCYIIDLPRSGENEKHMASIFKAIEQIKNGVVIDLRYKYTQLIMGSPQVWVFCNDLPDSKYLSKDRWVYYKVNKEKELRRLFKAQ